MRIINYKNRNWIIVCYYIFDALTYYFLFLRPFLYPLRLILIIDIISNIKYSTRSQKISVTIFFCLFMLALIIGLIKGNYDVYLLTDIFTFSLFLFLSLGDYIYGHYGNIAMVYNTIFSSKCYSINCISFNFIF